MLNNRSKKVRKDDKVLVISGNSRGKFGKVLKVLGDKVVVEGVNFCKKHVKPTRTAKGGIIEKEVPINVSNVKVCVDNDKPVKLVVKKSSDGKKELCYKDGAKLAVYRTVSK